MPQVVAIIPARYASIRFPGKPLADINGRPMIQWVYDKVVSCAQIDHTVVATDDERIAMVCRSFGAQVLMTASSHVSGTDRLAEAYEALGTTADIVINVQGDEPGLDPNHLEAVIALFDGKTDIGTLVCAIASEEMLQDPGVVKAVVGMDGRALYFSRSAIPYDRNQSGNFDLCYQHLGVYAYRPEVLKEISVLSPSPLELKESLEQLRWLESGYRIQATVVASAPIGVDTPADLERVKDLLKSEKPR